MKPILPQSHALPLVAPLAACNEAEPASENESAVVTPPAPDPHAGHDMNTI